MAHYLGELTESNMKNLQALIDSNSVIGREIVTPDGHRHPAGEQGLFRLWQRRRRSALQPKGTLWRRHRRRGHHHAPGRFSL